MTSTASSCSPEGTESAVRERYAFRMSEQIAIRIPTALAAQLGDLVATGRFETKADAVRTALEALIDAERRADVGRRIVEGYRRVPQEDSDVTAADEAATRSIEEEPW
jgi:Arc/MetJ-type ribon-helix-helix transcriptional regulator